MTSKKKSNINIVIENNIFSKNKTPKDDDKKKIEKSKKNTESGNISYHAPFQPEPSFISDIRQAFNDKNMYGFRHNLSPMYNPQGQPQISNYGFPPNYIQNQEYDSDDSDVEVFHNQPPQEQEQPQEIQQVQPHDIQQDPQAIHQETQSPTKIFDEDGNYLLPANTNASKKQKRIHQLQRDKYMLGYVKPHKKTIIKYGLSHQFN